MKDTLNITVYYTIIIKLTTLFNIAIQLGSLILQKSRYLLFRISCLTERQSIIDLCNKQDRHTEPCVCSFSFWLFSGAWGYRL